jgi:multiple sugar transport system permease protein
MNAVESLQVKRAGSREGWGLRAGGMALTIIVWIGALACLFPLLWTLVSSFRPGQSFLVSPFVFNPQELSPRNYATVFSSNAFPVGFANSAIQVIIILATTLFFCPLAGYGFAKFKFRGQNVLFGILMLTLFFVPITQYIPLLIEMNAIGWVNTYQGLVMPLVISSFGIFWMSGVIRGIPDELLHAARVDGCGNFVTWWRVVMPIIKPALVSLAVVTFLGAYNDYFWPLLILPSPSMQTIQIALAGLAATVSQQSYTTTGSWGPVLAGSTVVFLPTIVIFLAMQRYFVRGVLQGSLKE